MFPSRFMWACWVQSMGTGLSVLKGFSNIIVKASIHRDMSLQGFQEHGSKLVSHPYLFEKRPKTRGNMDGLSQPRVKLLL